MKIIFFCGSAKPGNDGVGDYTRRFSGALIRLGYEAQMLSLCDSDITSFTSENQEVEGTKVVVNRIPISASNKQRQIWTQEILNNFQPNWISFQFVSYSFNPKGLPFWLPIFLNKLEGNHKWHFMFHELWLGIDKEASIKHKCIGKVQQKIIKRIIYKINPNVINTQNQLYQFFLKCHNVNAEILPICSNIPLTAVKKGEKVFTQFVLFGTIHIGAPFNDFINDLVNTIELKKTIKFIFIGFNGVALSSYTSVLDKFNVPYVVLGIQPENVISQVLVDSDYGISTTPYFQTEKSGIYAAYKEHQLNTICVARNWTPTKGEYIIPHITRYEKNNFTLKSLDVKMLDLCDIANQFINSISKI